LRGLAQGLPAKEASAWTTPVIKARAKKAFIEKSMRIQTKKRIRREREREKRRGKGKSASE
jgi:hypothetical protein